MKGFDNNTIAYKTLLPLGLYLVDVLHKGFINFNSLYYIFHVLYRFMVQLGNLSKQDLALCLT